MGCVSARAYLDVTKVQLTAAAFKLQPVAFGVDAVRRVVATAARELKREKHLKRHILKLNFDSLL